jgi:hypothetical protein
MDVFGDVFATTRGVVIRLNTETGDIAEEWPAIDTWSADVLSDRSAVGQSFLKAWESVNGKLPTGHRLSPKMPVVFGGEFTVENMVAMSTEEIWKFRAEIVAQIRGLPNGARILLDTV